MRTDAILVFSFFIEDALLVREDTVMEVWDRRKRLGEKFDPEGLRVGCHPGFGDLA